MTTFAGREIEGNITTGSSPKEQHPESEFTNALNALLNTEGVDAVRWRQYTPYFNDGDPCVFSAYGTSVRLSGTPEDDESGDYSDGFVDEYSLKNKGEPAASIRPALDAFDDMIDNGHHNALLIKQFGDHAVVTATKEKFCVEFYEHD